MRHLIILPGNNVRNRAWGEMILTHYQTDFDSCFLRSYSHWESGKPNIDFNLEETKLEEHLATLPAGKQIYVMAKSVGSLLALLMINNRTVTPEHGFFFGLPLDLVAQDSLWKDWEPLQNLTTPSLAFHNLKDPTANYEFSRSILQKYAPRITLITTQEVDHWYGDLVTYDRHIKALIKRQ